jgi:diguanylate cyclase (GGDEF)-like protein
MLEFSSVANVRYVIEGIDQLRKELSELLTTSSSEEGLLIARFNRWSNRTHTQLSEWGLGQDANLFSGASHQIVAGDWHGNTSRGAKAKDHILKALRDDMEAHPDHYEPRLTPDKTPPVTEGASVPLSGTDLKVVSTVVHHFLDSKQPKARKPLLMIAGSADVLERLTRWSVLRSLDNNKYLPTALSFHYCGNADSLAFAKQSVELVARVLKSMFEKCDEEYKYFTLGEIEENAVEMFGKIDPEKIKLGLYLSNEFGLHAGLRGNTENTEIVSMAINEHVIEIENPETLWDAVIKKQTEWIKLQQSGGSYLGQPEPDDALELPHMKPSKQPSQKIFLAHGHNVGALNNVTRFLREQLGLDVVVLHELPNKGRTIIEKLEANAGDVGFAVVLLTPDDVGASKKNKAKLNERARQNVILELGYFIGKLGRDKVAAVYVKNVELPSDFDGMLYVKYDRRADWRSKLTREIKEAGIEVKETKFRVNEERANKDALTGLLDRRFFEETLSEEINRANSANGTFSLIVLDLDKFKSINNAYGHQEGDRLLVRVGAVLQRATPQTHILTRIGGDEFAVIAPGLETEQVTQLAEKLRSALATDNVLKKMKVKGSFGVATYPPDGTTPEVLIRIADERLYQSKSAIR